MEEIGEGLNGKITWMRCAGCSRLTLFRSDRLKQLRQSAEPRVRVVDAEDIEYDPRKSFAIGQYLYHPVWDDRGEVVRKEVTASGRMTIIVFFQRLGERRLVENLRG